MDKGSATIEADDTEPPPLPVAPTKPTQAKPALVLQATGEFLARGEIPSTRPPQASFKWGSSAADRFFDETPLKRNVRFDVIVLVAVALILCVAGFYTLLVSPSPRAPTKRETITTRPSVQERKMSLQAAKMVVVTQPEGASASLVPEGIALGKTPVTLLIPQDESTRIRLMAPGYKTVEVSLSYETALSHPEYEVILEPLDF